MKGSSQNVPFTFVSYEGAKLPKDPNVRNMIRRRAMRHTASIRKQKGGYRKHNVSQLPMWLLQPDERQDNLSSGATGMATDPRPTNYSDEEAQGTTIIARTEATAASDAYWFTSLCYPPTDIFMRTMSQNYSLLHLASPMTVLHLGISTLSYFRPDCTCISDTLSKMPSHLKNRRLLSFIPSRYGLVSSLTHATDSIIARLDHIVRSKGIRSSEWDTVALKHYAKALKSLQEAIDDENLRMAPETLCAVELLGIFELLNKTSSTDMWIRHAGGAARLIELRGPDRFQTDFELSLFMTHAGPIITEAFLNGKTCFLQEERWQQVIQAAIHNDPLVPPDQAHLVIKLWARLGKGPNLFKTTEDLILSPMHAPIEAREDLITLLVKEQENLKTWLILAEQYRYGPTYNNWRGLATGALALLRNYKNEKASAEQQMSWRILQGTYVLCCLVKMRLLYALSPSQFPELEATCQTLACEVMTVSLDSAIPNHEKLVGALFMSEVVWMAKAVIETKDIWSEGLGDAYLGECREDRGMIEQWKFKAWCKTIGRRVL